MRKREIHTVAHWCMMFILLMFPILMVGISGFGHSQYSEKSVENLTLVNSNNLVVEHSSYMVNYEDVTGNGGNIEVYNTNLYEYIDTNNKIISKIYFINEAYARINLEFTDSTTMRVDNWNNYTSSFYIELKSTNFNFTTQLTHANVYLVTYLEKQLDYRYDINQWINAFIDLPINSWYKSLMNVIGVGFTNSTVMNVIYVMPVYILWVFIFDVIVDCFLVIIKLPHKLLNRLSGGENE